MTTALRFPASQLEALRRARILGVRSGTGHRYTGVWVVVVERRVFVRSWSGRATGWYAALRREPQGSISLDGREVAIRASHVGSERLRGAVSRAYAGKYDTKASEKWVRGFAAPEREATTLDLVPE